MGSKYRRKSDVGGVVKRGASVPPVATPTPAKRHGKPTRKKGVAGVTPRPLPTNERDMSPHTWQPAGEDANHCPMCPGLWVRTGDISTLLHTPHCPELRVLWTHHGYNANDWDCFYGCPPMALGNSFTHHWECKFWFAHPELTPFMKDKGKFYEPGID